jgi:hypothetical protein
VCQWPVSRANPASPRNTAAMPAAIAQVGRRLRRVADIASASLTGHAATHSMQPVHSGDAIESFTSTASRDGHAFVHFAQSMHLSRSRLIRVGDSHETMPWSAP